MPARRPASPKAPTGVRDLAGGGLPTAFSLKLENVHYSPNLRVFWDEGDASHQQDHTTGMTSSPASALAVLTQFAAGRALLEGVFLGHGVAASLSLSAVSESRQPGQRSSLYIRGVPTLPRWLPSLSPPPAAPTPSRRCRVPQRELRRQFKVSRKQPHLLQPYRLLNNYKNHQVKGG